MDREAVAKGRAILEAELLTAKLSWNEPFPPEITADSRVSTAKQVLFGEAQTAFDCFPRPVLVH